MRIDRVTICRVRMPLVHAHRTVSLDYAHVEHILVRAEADGLVGWGECPTLADPYYLNETTETTWHVLERFVVPAVLGREWSSIAELTRHYARVKGNTFAKAGVEQAAWDLLAKAEGTSVAALLGGTRSEVEAGVTISIDPDPARTLDAVAVAVAQGYRRIKIKIAPGNDVTLLDRIRSRFPDAPLMADANSAYTLDDRTHLKQLDAFDLMMLEQPLGPLEFLEHAELQRTLSTPICLDESIRSLEEARLALELGSCRILCVKLASVGGLLVARQIYDLCQAREVPLWCGGMLDYGVGRAASLAFASLAGVTLPSDVSSSDRYFVDDIVDPPVRSEGGRTPVPAAPGFGHAALEKRIEERTAGSLTLRA